MFMCWIHKEKRKLCSKTARLEAINFSPGNNPTPQRQGWVSRIDPWFINLVFAYTCIANTYIYEHVHTHAKSTTKTKWIWLSISLTSRYLNVVLSAGTTPFFPPASTTMLHNVILSSIYQIQRIRELKFMMHQKKNY